MLVSAIIATRNRAAGLEACLRHLRESASQLEGRCEVIVVDNGSGDATQAVVAPFVQDVPEVFRYLLEPRKGKSRALNLGIAAAKGAVMAFTDDDCYVSPAWFPSIAGEFEADQALGGLCGRVELFDPQDAPVSIRTIKDRCVLDTPELALSVPMGANMAFRRQVFDRVGTFDVTMGPGSPGGAVAEDNDFVYRVWNAGYKLVYSPNVFLHHHHGRRTASELATLRKNYVVGRGAFYCKHILKLDITVAKLAYWELRNQFLRTVGRRDAECGSQPPVLRHLIDGACYGLAARFRKGELPGEPATR